MNSDGDKVYKEIVAEHNMKKAKKIKYIKQALLLVEVCFMLHPYY